MLLPQNRSYKDVSLLFKEKEIETRPSFIPLNLMRPYQNFQKGNLGVSEKLYDRLICLPTFVGLTKKEISFICSVLLKMEKD